MDINFRIRAEELGKSFEGISAEVEATLNTAIAQLAQATYSEGIRLAQQRLKTSKQDYIRSLNLYDIGNNIYIISLTGDQANYIENGWQSFDQKPGLLNGPKAKVSKKGTIYNTIPFTHNPYSKAPLNEKGTQLRSDLLKVIKANNLDKIIQDATGSPRQGIVARLKNTGVRNLEGLVKIQKTYDKATQSKYISFRRVSENSPNSSWIHPGYAGAHIFDDLEKYIDQQVDTIINAIL
ncbi:MAG TPA: hypothetical protein PLJ37_01130 [Chitinophagales bacterium]|nr:hypothetical protein [Chitinophagales bacterium]HMW93429.1 hypothetical protein [Chitinophagales bacterium]HMZ92948.1 hypothetical protein [Chitinophagales bacterium]HNG25988.1 hypothetical protein [Chitinophagales bacterium]